MNDKYLIIIKYIKELYKDVNPVSLHAPVFIGNEKKYILDCIDTTFVSYVGKYVAQFEEMTAQYTGSRYAVAVVNGTAALQIALQLAGVKPSDEVITQALTFAATANAIMHTGAKPIFVDVDTETLGMSPEALNAWLDKNVQLATLNGHSQPINKKTAKRIAAIVPMHTFGHPCRIDEIKEIADEYHIPLIEDSAESLGSFYKGRHTGTFGIAGILSYNGNKTITTGGGGMIITDNEEIAKRAKHITTTAKAPHPWEYYHDEVGYNYRLTNVSAAIGVAQMERLEEILANKRSTVEKYASFFKKNGIEFVKEPVNSKSNYWLNAIILNNRQDRDEFLEYSNNEVY